MSRHPVPPFARALAALACALWALPASSQTLALEWVDSASGGTDLNASGHVLGSKAVWPCGDVHACAPVYEPSVWRGGTRHVLPGAAGRYVSLAALGADGSVVGTLTDYTSQNAASRWVFDGSAYQRQDLGLLPGTSQSFATGIDAQGRVVGYAMTPFVSQKPFVWTAASGLVDLAALGFPNDRPMGVSPLGRVIADGHTYQLDDLASVQALPAPPAGFRAAQGLSLRVNDRGDLAGFLADTSGAANRYLHRYQVALGRWERLSDQANSPNQSYWGMGTLDAKGALSATVLGAGVTAKASDAAAQALQGRLSPAYPDTLVLRAQAHAGSTVLAHAGLGRATRLVKLVPAKPCTSACLQVSSLSLAGTFVNDPNAPGSCTDRARNKVRATLTVVDEAGLPQANALVKARYLDEYALSQPVQGRTDATGRLVLRHDGPACVGAVSLLVESVKRTGRTLDRTTGTLAGWVIPLP